MNMRFLLLAVSGLLIILVLAACRGDKSPQRITERSDVPSHIAVGLADIIIVETAAPQLTRVQPIPSNVVISPGTTLAFSAVSFDQVGREIEQVPVSWQVVDPRAGTITPGGVFRAGFNTGTFEDALVVTARASQGRGPGLVQATASITVAEISGVLRPASIRVLPEPVEVEPRESLQLLALALDANGVAIPNMKFRWESLEPVAGSISERGRLIAGESIGEFPKAIKVTLDSPEEDLEESISIRLDIHVVDLGSAAAQYSARILPQVISVRPEEQARFTPLVLDKRGNQISPVNLSWEIANPAAGTIFQRGHFVAGKLPGIYPEAVRVTMGLPGTDEVIEAEATVIIVEVVKPGSESESQRLRRVAIFPERIVLSPGESTRVSIVGLGGVVQRQPDTSVSWSVSPPEVGEVSRFVTVTAHDFPGIYEDAIRALVTLETEDGPVTQEVSATLIIRGNLDSVELIPKVATLVRGSKVQFRAVAYDESHILLPDVTFQWRVTDSRAGTIDADGLFTAQDRPGEYPGAVRVEAVQRIQN